jgi:hypothetical protein
MPATGRVSEHCVCVAGKGEVGGEPSSSPDVLPSSWADYTSVSRLTYRWIDFLLISTPIEFWRRGALEHWKHSFPVILSSFISQCQSFHPTLGAYVFQRDSSVRKVKKIFKRCFFYIGEFLGNKTPTVCIHIQTYVHTHTHTQLCVYIYRRR